jgi:hypothetical protein
VKHINVEVRDEPRVERGVLERPFKSRSAFKNQTKVTGDSSRTCVGAVTGS